MALKHDAQGFLAGDAIDIGVALSMWGDIRDDVRAIRQAMGRLATGSSTAQSDAKSVRATVTPLGRDSMGRFVKRDKPKEADPAVKAVQVTSSNSAITNSSTTVVPAQRGSKQAAATPGERDSQGRFKQGAADGNDSAAPGESSVKAFFDRLAGSVNGAANGLEEADPAVKAVQEVAQPLARGYQMLTGGNTDKRKEGWFRKIYGSLVGFRKDETAFSKAANKSLRNLEDKPLGGEGQAGFFGSLLSGVLGIGPFIMTALTALLAKIPGVGKFFGGGAKAAAGAAGTAGAAGAAVSGGGIKAAGKMLKRIPILGALLTLGMGASDAMAAEQDQTLGREDKNAKQGRIAGEVVGGLGGAAAGAAIGTLIFPGVGTVIGGVIGAVAGDWLGGNAGEVIGQNFKGITDSMAAGWAGVVAGFMVVSDALGINWAAIGEVFLSIGVGIGSAWDSAISGFKAIGEGIGKAWGLFVDSAKAGWDSFTGLFSAAYEGLKKIPIIGAGIQAAEDAAKAAAAAAKEAAIKAATAVKEKAVEVAVEAKDKVVAVVDKTVAVTKEAGAAAKTAYVEKMNPGAGPAGPAPVGVVNQTAAAVGGAAGSVVRVGKNALAAGERASEMQKAVAGYTSDPKAQAMLMANMDHESAGFTRYDENLNYSSVEQIRKTFKGNKGITGMSDDQVQGLVKSPEKLANVVYADSNRGESSKLGNTEEGDGYKYRGRGALQITGRSNYAELGMRMGMGDTLEKNPDMLANDPALAARASIEFLKMNQSRVAPALKSGDDAGLRKVINGGDNGLQDVISKTAKWEQKNQPIAVPAAITAPVQTAFAAAPKVPAFAPPQVVTEAPQVVNPLTSGADSKRAITVSLPAQDVGQDVRDRRIAHIVTGGFST